jgi:hypothetical protein
VDAYRSISKWRNCVCTASVQLSPPPAGNRDYRLAAIGTPKFMLAAMRGETVNAMLLE